jgi:ribosomal protein S18 acetylase RimI-like enzyme
MSIKLKNGSKLDYDQVVEIFFSNGFLQFKDKRDEYKKSIITAFSNSQFIVSAWEDKELVGFARVLSDKEIFATIWNLMVKKQYQGLGIGSKLIQKCLEKYPNAVYFLFASKETEKFYEKLGFQKHSFGMATQIRKAVCSIYT